MKKTAVILAGGKSKRMKADKALLPVGNKKLIEVIIDQLKDFFEEILISASEKGRYEFTGCPVVIDRYRENAALSGILSSLYVSKNSVNFFIACDIPEIDRDFLTEILSYSINYDIVVPSYKNGRYEPLFALYNKGIIPLIEEQISYGNMKIDPLFFKCRTRFVEMDNEKWFRNMNTKKDYEDYISGLK